jgi:hypothetical protein
MALIAANRHTDVRAAARSRGAPSIPTSGRRAPNIFVPKRGALVGSTEWFWKELREGGKLRRYLDREKSRADSRLRRVARQTHTFQQNPRADVEVAAHVPLLDYLRWQKVDPHFWDDRANLKSFRRDNPEARIYSP